MSKIDKIYKDRLENNSNDDPYIYIKKYESNMKWYKTYIIIIVIALIVLIALIIMGVIKIDTLPAILIISGLLSGYYAYWYNQNKKNRNRTIMDTKNKIQVEIDEKLNIEIEKQITDKNYIKPISKSPKEHTKNENNKQRIASEKLNKIKEIISNKDPNYILDTERYNINNITPPFDFVYDFLDTKTNPYPGISDNQNKNLNTILKYSFDDEYYSDLNTAVQRDNEISQDIKKYIKDKIVQTNSERYH